MLTKQQQQIIADMSNSFAKVNEQFSTSKSFNLINLDELHMLNRKKEEFEENVRIAKENWNRLAEAEVYRIISLLQSDLPNAFIEKMGKANGHYEGNSILIGRTKDSLNGHCSARICIDIEQGENMWIKDEYGNSACIPSGLSYEGYFQSPDYKENFSDIQSLCSSTFFIDKIRRIVL